MKFRTILGAALLALADIHGANAAECGPLRIVNKVQMQRIGPRDLIPLSINDSALLFLFDTGGVTTMIGRERAEELKLPVRQGNLEFYDLTGNISRDQATVSQ